MEEYWKNINGYEGLYKASNFGRIKRLERQQKMPVNNKVVTFKERILKQSLMFHKNNPNYVRSQIVLCKNGRARTKSVARIIAETFLDHDSDKNEVHHIDHNPQNNNLNNLKWVNRKEQFDDHHRELFSKSIKGKAASNKIKVKINGKAYDSMSEASLSVCKNSGAIANARYKGNDKIFGNKFEIIQERKQVTWTK